MKIRTQNMLAFVPLFLGLAALIGALMYVVQYRELVWGLDEEATSIAVAAAHHMNPTAIREAADQADWGAVVADPLRLLHWGLAQRIALVTPNSEVLYDSARETDMAERPIALSSALLGRLDAQPFAATPVQQDERGRYMMAFSPIQDDEGVAAILMIETSADSLAEHEARMFRTIRVMVIVSVLAGIVLAWFISRLISRRIVSLTRAAAAVSAGQYDQTHETGGVQEINDLSNTFNTMSSVLSEVISRARRAVVEAEQFRTDDDLARAFTRTFMAEEQRSMYGVTVAAGHVGPRADGHFFGLWEKGDDVMAAVGEIPAKNGLQGSLQASAAAAALYQCWRNGHAEDACAEWAALFKPQQADVLVWNAHSDAWLQGTWDPAQQTMIFKNVTWTQRPIVLATVPEQAALRIRLYAESFDDLAPHELAAELRLLLDRETMGALMVLKHN